MKFTPKDLAEAAQKGFCVKLYISLFFFAGGSVVFLILTELH